MSSLFLSFESPGLIRARVLRFIFIISTLFRITFLIKFLIVLLRLLQLLFLQPSLFTLLLSRLLSLELLQVGLFLLILKQIEVGPDKLIIVLFDSEENDFSFDYDFFLSVSYFLFHFDLILQVHFPGHSILVAFCVLEDVVWIKADLRANHLVDVVLGQVLGILRRVRQSALLLQFLIL